MAKLKQATIWIVLGFVVLAIMNRPGQTSNLAQDIGTIVGSVLHNIWVFISTLFTAAAKGS